MIFSAITRNRAAQKMQYPLNNWYGWCFFYHNYYKKDLSRGMT